MKGVWGLVAVLCVPAALPAAAGTLYRCDTGDGIPHYVSTRISGARCTAVANYRPEPARRAPPAAAPSERRLGNVTEVGAPGASNANPPATFMGRSRQASANQPAAPASPPAAAPAASAPSSGGGTQRVVQGQLYSYIKDGVRHYTSQRPASGVAQGAAVRTIPYSIIETCYACAPRGGVSFATVRLNTDAFRNEISAAAREFGVEEAIVRAVMHAESAFNPNALSHAGAQGLMQLMPATASRFGVVNPFDPQQNIRGGVQYLAWLLRRFDGNLTLAAAGYNAGEGAVDRHGGVPPFRETRTYVERVGILVERYRGHMLASGAP